MEDGPGGLMALLTRPGVRQGMMATGMALLAQKDRRGSLGGALGNALPYGMQAFEQGQQQSEFEKALESMPDGPQKQLLMSLGPQVGGQAALGMMQPREQPQGSDRYVNMGDGVVWDTVDRAFIEGPNAGADETTDDITEYQYAQENGYLGSFADWMKERKPEGVTVNTGNMQAELAGPYYGELQEGYNLLPEVTATIREIDTAIDLTRDPKFRSGPLVGTQNFLDNFTNDAEAVAVNSAYDVLTARGTVQELAAFTGPKTDEERQYAERMASNDRSVRASGLRAGLSLRRRVALAEAKDWADQVLRESRPPNTPEHVWAEYQRRAQQIVEMYREELANAFARGAN